MKDNDPGPLLRNAVSMLSELFPFLNQLFFSMIWIYIFSFRAPHILPSACSQKLPMLGYNTLFVLFQKEKPPHPSPHYSRNKKANNKKRTTPTKPPLEPNGHLQWSEYDSTTLRTLHASPSLPSSSLRAIPAFVSALKPHDPHARIGEQDWISRLPELFETLTTDTPASSTPAYSTPASSTLNANSAPALTCILSSRYATSPAWLPYQLDVFLLTYDELAGKVLDHLPGVGGEGEGVGREGVRREGSETAGSKLRTLIEQAREEGKRGVGWGIDRLVVVGRKRGAEGEGEGGKKKVAGGVGHVKGEEEGGKMLKSDENAIDDVGGGDGNGNLEQASPAPGPSALPVPPSTTTLQKDTSHPPPTPRTPRRTNRNLRSKWKRVWNRMRMVSR